MQVWLLLLTTWLASGLGLQAQPEAPVDPTFYAVSYFETTASSANVAADALRKYRDASRKLPGFVRIDFFEQIGRPGHFVVFETWRDLPAFDGRDAAIQKTLVAALEPIRVAGYDQRPYKTLTIGNGPAAAVRQAGYGFCLVDVDRYSAGPPH